MPNGQTRTDAYRLTKRLSDGGAISPVVGTKLYVGSVHFGVLLKVASKPTTTVRALHELGRLYAAASR